MIFKYFFDVPVYRLSENKYYSERTKYVEKKLYPGAHEVIKKKQEFYKDNPNHKLMFEECLIRAYGGQWMYNEIIGFIRLHFVGRQIRGEYYSLDSKRIVKTRRKQFEFKAWKLAVEINIPKNSNSIEIYTLICEYLDNCKKELKQRYVDTSLFTVLGPHIDWASLLNNT